MKTDLLIDPGVDRVFTAEDTLYDMVFSLILPRFWSWSDMCTSTIRVGSVHRALRLGSSLIITYSPTYSLPCLLTHLLTCFTYLPTRSLAHSLTTTNIFPSLNNTNNSNNTTKKPHDPASAKKKKERSLIYRRLFCSFGFFEWRSLEIEGGFGVGVSRGWGFVDVIVDINDLFDGSRACVDA